MRPVPVIVPIAIAVCLSLLPGGPGRIAVRVDPPGCKPSPPFGLAVRSIPIGARAARIEMEVEPRFDARRIEVEVDAPDGVSLAAADPRSASDVRAGDRFVWRGTLLLRPGEAGGRVLVHARMRFVPPGRPGGSEQVSALREVVLGNPPPAVPGRIVRAGGVETVDVPAVPMR